MKKLILSSVLILAAGSVFAEDGKKLVLDADKEGLVSIEEAKVDASLSAAFAELDDNQDGYLSELELTPKID